MGMYNKELISCDLVSIKFGCQIIKLNFYALKSGYVLEGNI